MKQPKRPAPKFPGLKKKPHWLLGLFTNFRAWMLACLGFLGLLGYKFKDIVEWISPQRAKLTISASAADVTLVMLRVTNEGKEAAKIGEDLSCKEQNKEEGQEAYLTFSSGAGYVVKPLETSDFKYPDGTTFLRPLHDSLPKTGLTGIDAQDKWLAENSMAGTFICTIAATDAHGPVPANFLNPKVRLHFQLKRKPPTLGLGFVPLDVD